MSPRCSGRCYPGWRCRCSVCGRDWVGLNYRRHTMCSANRFFRFSVMMEIDATFEISDTIGVVATDGKWRLTRHHRRHAKLNENVEAATFDGKGCWALMGEECRGWGGQSDPITKISNSSYTIYYPNYIYFLLLYINQIILILLSLFRTNLFQYLLP